MTTVLPSPRALYRDGRLTETDRRVFLTAVEEGMLDLVEFREIKLSVLANQLRRSDPAAVPDDAAHRLRRALQPSRATLEQRFQVGLDVEIVDQARRGAPLLVLRLAVGGEVALGQRRVRADDPGATCASGVCGSEVTSAAACGSQSGTCSVITMSSGVASARSAPSGPT